MNGLIARSMLGLLFVANAAIAQDKIVFATDWLAQAEHGGFYQAVAEGTYASTASTSRSGWAARRSTDCSFWPPGSSTS